MVSSVKRVHRNPKLNPGWEVGVEKGFFEEITLETQQLNNKPNKMWREGGTLEKSRVRAIGQKRVWPVSRELKRL